MWFKIATHIKTNKSESRQEIPLQAPPLPRLISNTTAPTLALYPLVQLPSTNPPPSPASQSQSVKHKYLDRKFSNYKSQHICKLPLQGHTYSNSHHCTLCKIYSLALLQLIKIKNDRRLLTWVFAVPQKYQCAKMKKISLLGKYPNCEQLQTHPDLIKLDQGYK